jgi:uncharacterized protein
MDHAGGTTGKAAVSARRDSVKSDPVAQQRAVASCGIAFMAKASAPGRTKTRLVPPLTFDEAAALNTAFLEDVADNLLAAACAAADFATIAAYAAYSPLGSEDFFRRTLPPPVDLIPAALPNFGDCLWQAIEALFARGHAAAVVLNSDSPTLPTALLNETAAVLARPGDRAVLGPSSDGGYYLLGLKAPHRRMFEDIAWSTDRVAGQTLERAREVGLDVHLLAPWYDVDDVSTLCRLRAELDPCALGTRHDVLRPHHARRTVALIDRLSRIGEFTGRTADFIPDERLSA